jgi:hypothetical protein
MDSDMVFDHEMTSRTIKDIMALFLLTSSTIIYNSKYNLGVIQKFCLIKKNYIIKTLFFISQIKDLLKLQNSISRISIFDNSMNILQKVLFLIRDWNPEDPIIKLGFGSANGQRYGKNLIETEKRSVNIEVVNCYLMSAPGPDVHLETINLSKMMDQFKVDLKNLIPFRFSYYKVVRKVLYVNSIELYRFYVKNFPNNLIYSYCYRHYFDLMSLL